MAHPAESSSLALKIFFANCGNCHGADATGGQLGPSLVKLARRRRLTAVLLESWIVGHVREPSADSMPRYRQLTDEERKELAEWLVKLDKPLEPKASAPKPSGEVEPPPAFTSKCAFCHGKRGEGNIGPPLVGVTSKPARSKEDLLKVLDNSRAYGLKDPMPASFPSLSKEDKRSIVEWMDRLKPR